MSGKRLNPFPGFIRCASLTAEYASKKNLFVKFYLLKYNFIFHKWFYITREIGLLILKYLLALKNFMSILYFLPLAFKKMRDLNA